jgi:hypothetical protein
MDVEGPTVVPVVEAVFAVGLHPFEDPPVEEGRSGREPALRGPDAERFASEP